MTKTTYIKTNFIPLQLISNRKNRRQKQKKKTKQVAHIGRENPKFWVSASRQTNKKQYINGNI